MLHFTCQHCDREVPYTLDRVGSKIDCPLCGRSVTVPVPLAQVSDPARALSGPLVVSGALPDTSTRTLPLVPQTLWQRTWKFVLGLFSIIGAAFMFLAETRAVVDYSDSSSWPTTIGKVETSTVQMHIHRVKGIPITSYKPLVTYVYVVGPLAYRNTKLRFGGEYTLNSGTTEATARREADKYPPGSTVEVIHDPNDPWNTVLERRMDSAAYPMLITMLACGFLGMRLVLVSLAPFSFERTARWGGVFARRWRWYDWCLLALFAGFGIWQILLMPYVV